MRKSGLREDDATNHDGEEPELFMSGMLVSMGAEIMAHNTRASTKVWLPRNGEIKDIIRREKEREERKEMQMIKKRGY